MDLYTREQERIEKAICGTEKQIAEIYGSESIEMQAWNRQKEAMSFTIGCGARKAADAWIESLANKSSEFEMEESLLKCDVEGFIKKLREAGIETFAYTAKNTDVIANLHAFAEEGCSFEEFCIVTRETPRWGGTTHQGIRFKVN